MAHTVHKESDTTQDARILIVDDEVEIRRALQRNLQAHGFDVIVAGNGEEALEKLALQRPDLVILDLGLPDMNGLEICKQVRTYSHLPIIILSVRDAEREKVQALDLGADDYITKPFGIDEVLARVRVALRHVALMQGREDSLFIMGPLKVDFGRRLVTLDEQEVRLTPTEYDLLKALILNRGKIMTRQMLLSQVWGTGYGTEAHYLHVYIGQLRRKIEADPVHPRLITTISGVGYRFSAVTPEMS
jgi:two-component system KDP operon response regulator KdpE